MDSLSPVPPGYHHSWMLVATRFISWYSLVIVLLANVTEVRGTYRPIEQKQRTARFTPDPRIVGGTLAAPNDYPFYVNTIPPTLCGGTLITPDIVLTAAHCGGGFLGGVIVGGTLRNSPNNGESLAVDFEFPHTEYNATNRVNDIMLVKLANPSTRTRVELNFDASVPTVDDPVTVIGFGDTTENGELSNELLTVTVDTYADIFCFNLFKSYVPASMICAGTAAGGRDACQGDSGGPLLTADNVQVGIVSAGLGCGRPNIPSIYTEIAAFQSFIRDGICALSDTPPADCGPTKAPVVAPVTNNPVVVPVAPPVASPTKTKTGAPVSDNPVVVPAAPPVASPTKAKTGAPVTNNPVVIPVASPVASPTKTKTGAPVSDNPIVIPVAPPITTGSPIVTTVPSLPNGNTIAPNLPMMMMGMGQMMMMGMGKKNMDMNMNMDTTTIRSTPVSVVVSTTPTNDHRNHYHHHHHQNNNNNNMDIRWKKLLHELN